MSVVIVGGNECMTRQYEKVCSSHGYKAKIFAKENGNFRKKLGNPNLHSSSIAALDTMLAGYNA